jgi:macrolide phosphotransferase
MTDQKQALLTIVEKHDVILKKDSIDFANIGLDFQVAMGTDRHGTDWVLRFPRRKDAYLKTKQEKETLDFLNKTDLPFQVPKWEIYSEKLIAYQALNGTPAVTTDAETGETTWAFDEKNIPFEYTKTLGQALAALHAGEMKNVGNQTIDLQKEMKKRMNTVKNNYEIDADLWKRWQDWVENEELWPKNAGFIHGDMYPGHTLIDENYSVTGIIDWTEAKLADSSQDFVSHYMLFGENELEKLIQVYQEAGGYTWPKMKEHIIELHAAQAITIAEFSMSSGLEEYEQMTIELLKNKQ